MSNSKTPCPFNVKRRAGRNINPDEKLVLSRVREQLYQAGYTVLDSLFARAPGMLIFYATTYKSDFGLDGLPPFGVTRVNFLNNGDVTVKVMGCEPDGTPVVNETKTQDFKWRG